MSHNRFGHLFCVSSWGESHGEAIGCTIDGTPPRLVLTEQDIQFYLDRRRPAQSHLTSQRKEPDKVKILSGILRDEKTGKDFTTGTPIQLIIENKDAKSKDYKDIANKFRPSHADFTYTAKYGIRDWRGGGRASARETATRVAAGAVARKIIPKISIKGALVQLGNKTINRKHWRWSEIDKNPFYCPDPKAVKEWETYLTSIRKKGSSCGAVIELTAKNVPTGLGAPIYGKLDADLAHAIMSINAVKAVEIGAGFQAAKLSGEDNADEMRQQKLKPSRKPSPRFTSNQAGGILGGISTGQNIVLRFAVKPTSSILTPRKTITKTGKNTTISTKGRHDPCVGIRAVAVGEAMMACVLADHMLRHRAQNG